MAVFGQSKEELRALELLLGILELNETQIQIVLALNQHEKLCVKRLGKLLGKKRSTVQKNLSSLKDSGLVRRNAFTLEEFREHCSEEPVSGVGYLYLYECCPRAQIFDLFEESIQNYSKALSALKSRAALSKPLKE